MLGVFPLPKWVSPFSVPNRWRQKSSVDLLNRMWSCVSPCVLCAKWSCVSPCVLCAMWSCVVLRQPLCAMCGTKRVVLTEGHPRNGLPRIVLSAQPRGECVPQQLLHISTKRMLHLCHVLHRCPSKHMPPLAFLVCGKPMGCGPCPGCSTVCTSVVHGFASAAVPYIFAPAQ